MARNIKPPPNGRTFCGMREIAEEMRVSQPTIHRWIKELGFPVVYERGEAITTSGAIDMWVAAISASPERFAAGGPPWFIAQSSNRGLNRIRGRLKRKALTEPRAEAR